MISRYKYRNFALKSQITTRHSRRGWGVRNHQYRIYPSILPLNLPSCHYRVCGIDLCRRRYNPNPHRSETMGIGVIWASVFFLLAVWEVSEQVGGQAILPYKLVILWCNRPLAVRLGCGIALGKICGRIKAEGAAGNNDSAVFYSQRFHMTAGNR